MENLKTLREAVIYFSDFENCKAVMVQLRWPDGIVKCPQCGSEKVTYLAKNRVWKCYTGHPRPKFSLKTGTVFEDSPIALEKWLPALWLVVNCKNGISSCELARDLGITQKSAWFMAHRLRYALKSGGFTLSGECEADETFIGGKARNMHMDAKKRRITGSGPKDKTVVFGVLQRGDDCKPKDRINHSKVLTMVVPNRRKKTLQKEIRANVAAGSALYSDALLSYEGLEKDYAHKVVDHAVEYVRGKVHTNGMENFWCLTDRMINGTYVSIEPFHTFRYLDEISFRYNNRGTRKAPVHDGDRFIMALAQVNSMPMRDTATIAVYMIEEVKEHVNWCGGNTQVITIDTHGHTNFLKDFDVEWGRRRFRQFDTSLEPLMVAVGNYEISEQEFVKRLRGFVTTLRGMRKELVNLHRAIDAAMDDW